VLVGYVYADIDPTARDLGGWVTVRNGRGFATHAAARIPAAWTASKFL
jgi:hypothetical protein